jgi:dihydroorotase
MKPLLISGAQIVNEGMVAHFDVLIEDTRIAAILPPGTFGGDAEILNAAGKFLLPGVIDDQVHFREPGLTEKGEIYTEARAAVAGGTTSYMEMPNTRPQTITQQLLAEKYRRAGEVSLANYSFYMGATNDNLSELLRTNPRDVCGIKVFMGASTGNMLVDNPDALRGIFSEAPCLVAVHCEDENRIRQKSGEYRLQFDENVPVHYHPLIRDHEACYNSSSLAVEMAAAYGTRLHVLHLSTARETALFSNTQHRSQKKITAEVCVHHLWFDDTDYARLGNRIKWNPAIKTAADREALWEALNDGRIDVVATDHAPHTAAEKNLTYFNCPSGGPLVQHSLVAMLGKSLEGKISLAGVVDKMCHAPADIFHVEKRGYIRPGYYADLVLADLHAPWVVTPENILYKCGWSPFEGRQFRARITHTFVNGHLAWENGHFDESCKGMRLLFDNQL